MTNLAKHSPSPGAPDLDGILASTLANLKHLAASAGGEAQHALSATTTALAHAAQALLEETTERSAVLARGAAKQVRKRPLATVAAVTVAAAAVIAMVAAQRHSHEEAEDQETRTKVK